MMASEMATAAGAWRNRITRHADVPPAELVANPRNFRRHGRAQADALNGVLSEVGVVQSVIVNERTGRMLDGHLRAELAVARGEPTVPVVYVDLDDAEERLILATFDPLGAMADADGAALLELLGSVTATDDAVQRVVQFLAEQHTTAAVEPPAEFPEYGDDIETQYECPSCHYAWSGRPSPETT